MMKPEKKNMRPKGSAMSDPPPSIAGQKSESLRKRSYDVLEGDEKRTKRGELVERKP